MIKSVQLLFFEHALGRCVFAELVERVADLSSRAHRHEFVEAVDERVALQQIALHVRRVERVVQTALVTETQDFLQRHGQSEKQKHTGIRKQLRADEKLEQP